ncbi:MAG: hypothetical protein ABH827_03615 [bacterium]
MSISNAISQKIRILNFFTPKILLIFLTIFTFTLSCVYGHIGQEEREYLNKRKDLVAQAQNQYTGCQLQTHPKIAFCFSGGGSRSQTCSLGFLLGAAKTGLQETATHMAALSGSTWNLIPLMTRQSLQKESLLDYRTNLQKRLEAKYLKNLNLKEILKKLAVKLATYGTVETADIWGALLANRFMGDLTQAGQTYTLASIRDLLNNTDNLPFPIFTAIVKDTFDIIGEYEWFEINPFVSGCHDWNHFIPTESLGSYFENSNLLNKRPEESLGFLMGIFGSPYDLNIGDLFRQLTQLIPETFKYKYLLLGILDHLIKKYHLTETNFLPSPIDNPTYKYTECPYSKKSISLADAGIDFDLPIAPLLERKAEIIICCDASSDATHLGFPELKMAERYARLHNYNFPSLKYYDQITKNMFIFKYNEYKRITDRTTPTIIYISNPISEPITKMQYSKEEFDTLCDCMQNIVTKNQNAIAHTIIEKSNQEKTNNSKHNLWDQREINTYREDTLDMAKKHRAYRKKLWSQKA